MAASQQRGQKRSGASDNTINDPSMSHEFVVVQYNLLQASLAMNTFFRGMQVDSDYLDKLLAQLPNKCTTWSAVVESCNKRFRAENVGGFWNSRASPLFQDMEVGSVYAKALRYSWDASIMGSGMMKDELLASTVDRYFECLAQHSEEGPFMHGAFLFDPRTCDKSSMSMTSGRPVLEILAADANTLGDLWTRRPAMLATKIGVHTPDGIVEVLPLYGALKEAIMGDLDATPSSILVQVYEHIMLPDKKLSWSTRMPMIADMITNSASEDQVAMRENLHTKYFSFDPDTRPALILLQEFEMPMAMDSGACPGLFSKLREKGFVGVWYDDESAIFWDPNLFSMVSQEGCKVDVLDHHTFSSNDFPIVSSNAQLTLPDNTATSSCGQDVPMAAWNVVFEEKYTKSGIVIDAKGKEHAGALLRLQHSSGQTIFAFCAHLQTTTLDGPRAKNDPLAAGEMRAYELAQLWSKIESTAQPGDLLIGGGDWNADFHKNGVQTLLGNIPASLVINPLNGKRVDTRGQPHEYMSANGSEACHGVKFELNLTSCRTTLLDAFGGQNQLSGSISSKTTGRSEMIDTLFADERMTVVGTSSLHIPNDFSMPNILASETYPSYTEPSDHTMLVAKVKF